jgi:hypothetical protein
MTTEEPDPQERAAWDALAPDEGARQRMERAVLAAYAIQHRPLTDEWLELLRARPLANTLLLAAAAAVLLLATPVGALVAFVLGSALRAG